MTNKLSVNAEATTAASPQAIWALVANANTYATWGPWNAACYVPPATGPSQVGMTQLFAYGRSTKSQERILEVETDRRIVYTVEKGIPVKNYRAEVLLTPTPDGGTHLKWSATWDRTLLGKIVHRKLATLYPEIVAALIKGAEDQKVG